METKKAVMNGQEIDVVVKLDDDFKDECVFEDLEDTMELPLPDISSSLDDTKVIDVGGING